MKTVKVVFAFELGERVQFIGGTVYGSRKTEMIISERVHYEGYNQVKNMYTCTWASSGPIYRDHIIEEELEKYVDKKSN